MSGAHQLAQCNVARLRADLDDPAMAGFLRAFPDVMWLADQAPGFVWRYRPEGSVVALAELVGEGRVAATLSVWENFEALQQ